MRRCLLVCAIAFASCADPAEPVGPTVTSHVVEKVIPLQRRAALDLLFVVDNSPAMAAHRPTLVANAKGIVDVMRTLPGGLPDLHIGVVNTDAGTRGPGETSAPTIDGCSQDGDTGRPLFEGPVTGRFLSDVGQLDGSRVMNYTGELDRLLQANFDRPSTGCTFVRPLEAMRQALTNAANAGFLREHASLAVVFLTAQDDCSFVHGSFVEGAADTFRCVSDPSSLVPVTEYATFLKALKGDPTKVVVMGAFGPASPFITDPQNRTVEPSCTIEQRGAAPGVRLQAFLDLFPNRALFTSICQADLTEVMSLIDQLFKVTLGAACFDEVLADVDPVTPGVQLECSASVVETFGARRDESLLSQCTTPEPTGGRCWRFRSDSAACPLGGPLLVLANTFASADSDNAFLTMQCVVE